MSLFFLQQESKLHVQLSLQEIVGVGRDDTNNFSYMIFRDSIKIAFEIQQAGSVS